MVDVRQEAEFRQSRGVISIHDRNFRRLMEERTITSTSTSTSTSIRGKGLDSKTSMKQNMRQQGYGKKMMFSSSSYFGMESLVLLICLTASLLILPLVLPPLPPPPFMLLSLPIFILGGLVIFAFSSSDAIGLTSYTYM